MPGKCKRQLHHTQFAATGAYGEVLCRVQMHISNIALHAHFAHLESCMPPGFCPSDSACWAHSAFPGSGGPARFTWYSASLAGFSARSKASLPTSQRFRLDVLRWLGSSSTSPTLRSTLASLAKKPPAQGRAQIHCSALLQPTKPFAGQVQKIQGYLRLVEADAIGACPPARALQDPVSQCYISNHGVCCSSM